MTNKEKLIEFVEWKHNRIMRLTGVVYSTPEDIEDIHKWSEKTCADVLEKLDDIRDEDACPWCIRFHDNTCGRCGYKTRHGRCGVAIINTYEKILIAIDTKYPTVTDTSIVKLIGPQMNLKLHMLRND